MAKQLTLDELIEAADRARLPTAKPIMRAIESLAMALGADLAERLGVLCGEAHLDSLDGLVIAFPARTEWQPCPEALRDFDPDKWDEAPQPPTTDAGERGSPERPETMAMFVARYQNRYGESVTRVFPTTTLARAWKNEIGRDWDAVRDGPPRTRSATHGSTCRLTAARELLDRTLQPRALARASAGRRGMTRPCPCGSGLPSWWENDARGIPLARVCDACIDEKLAAYRPEVVADPTYWTDEPIDDD